MVRALVLGDAANVDADAKAAIALFTPDAIFATNNIGIYWPHVDVWCSLHPHRCNDWDGMRVALEKRTAAGRNKPETWGHRTVNGIESRSSDWGGSTGLLAVKVALEKGFTHIVLAGIPLTPEAAHFYDKAHTWTQCNMFRRAWRTRLAFLKDKVRSCSGWTQQLLGSPTLEWLECNGESQAANASEEDGQSLSVSAA